MQILSLKEFNESKNIQKLNSLNGFSNLVVLPGFCDVHVHFREPGFEYKEDIKSGTKSALNGGYTSVMTMPNLKPAPHNVENLKVQLDSISKNSKIEILPYATITENSAGEKLADMEKLAPYVLAYTDDGKGVQSSEMMLKAMQTAKKLDKIIVAHCEDNSLLDGGYIHDGEYAKLNGHKGICSKSEWGQIERDIELAKKVGVKYHVCHVSTKEGVALIRKAKSEGVDVTCETAPHYLIFNDMQMQDDGKFKMNPPIRSEEDRLALIEGIKDGTIDMIATDHAPHTAEEKSKGLKGSLNGIVGLECAFSVLYTHLVKTGIITLEKLVELMSINPRKRFNIPFNDGYSVWDLSSEYQIDANDFLGKGKCTPFDKMKVFAVLKATIIKDEVLLIK